MAERQFDKNLFDTDTLFTVPTTSNKRIIKISLSQSNGLIIAPRSTLIKSLNLNSIF